jgi:hypothetical protein
MDGAPRRGVTTMKTSTRRRAALACAEHWPRALALALMAAATLPLLGRTTPAAPAATPAAEWPQAVDGAPLRPLALSAVERRFAERFPGRIGRFESPEATWVLRDVSRPTRTLHPASDCFRGLGYRIGLAQLEHDGQSRLWRCFVAEQGGQRVRVCERIVDANAQAFTDTSAWFWAATLGQSAGPWRAMTRVEAL